ncbi:hypothetical protein AB0L41_01685 [Amycolatopsis mediterranei]|uniref:hypothetical protein n=1 Tax=Amycolatopsis mediterranei TaxID=33910 RepID=UPI00342CFCEC
MASVESVRAVPLHAPYPAGKFTLRGFSGCLRIELAQEGAPIAVTTSPRGHRHPVLRAHAQQARRTAEAPAACVRARDGRRHHRVRLDAPPPRDPRGRRRGRVLPRAAALPGAGRRLLSLRRVGSHGFRNTLPDNGTDYVDAAVDEPGQVHGSHPAR